MWLRWLLIGVLVFAGWWFWGRTIAPVRVIRAQLHAADIGRFSVAYGYLSAEAQSKLTLDQFTTQVKNNPVIQQPLDATFLSRKMENGRATITGTLEGMDGQLSDLSYVLVKEGNEWKILSFQWSRPRLASD